MRLLLIFSVLLISSCVPDDNIFIDTKEDSSPETVEKSPAEEAETAPISEAYPWWDKYSSTLLDCYQEDNARKHGLSNWSPVTVFFVCYATVEIGYREVYVIDAEDERSNQGSQHNRVPDPENPAIPGDALDFFMGEYSGNCEDDNDKYLRDFIAFRRQIDRSKRMEKMCGLGFYPKRRSIHLDCRGKAARWCHYYEGEKLIKTSITNCIVDYEDLKRDCS